MWDAVSCISHEKVDLLVLICRKTIQKFKGYSDALLIASPATKAMLSLHPRPLNYKKRLNRPPCKCNQPTCVCMRESCNEKRPRMCRPVTIQFVSEFQTSSGTNCCRLAGVLHFDGNSPSTSDLSEASSTTGHNRWGLCPLPPFYLMMKAEFSFRSIVILWFYNLYDGQSPKEQFLHIITCHRQKPSNFDKLLTWNKPLQLQTPPAFGNRLITNADKLKKSHVWIWNSFQVPPTEFKKLF
jgi:hypothetical protein